jgi:hypothetical protein
MVEEVEAVETELWFFEPSAARHRYVAGPSHPQDFATSP